MSSYLDLIQQRRRIQALALVAAVICVLMGVRLFWLQVVRHAAYAQQASVEHSRKYEIPAERGQLYVYDGSQSTPIVLDQSLNVIYADPRFVTNKDDTAAKLAKVLGGKASDYQAAMDRGGQYVELAGRITDSQAAQVKALRLPGIGQVARDYSTYPEGSLASQVIGFVDASGKGQYGVEGYLNKQLSGTPGELAAKTDTLGIPIATANNVEKQPVNGTSYQLTIDRNVQAQAEKVLAAGVTSNHAVSGSIIIADPNTGAIMAMANYPTYDPNSYNKVTDYSLFSNAAVSGQFEPGSGFKAITMAAGIDQGKVTPDSTFDDTGSFTVGGATIRNSENEAEGPGTSMTKVMELSLNTGVIYVLRTLGSDVSKITMQGKQTLYDYVTKHFGFGQLTGIEQTGEAKGSVPQPTAPDLDYATMTFGQGVGVTMIQMVAAMGAIANGGTLYQPHVIAGVVNSDGSVTPKPPTVVRSHILTPKAVGQLVPMLEQVVQHGTAYSLTASNPGYLIAGKTGTAQIAAPDGSGYIKGKNIGSFLGFAPADHPKFVMMIRINEPSVASGFAETSTVPLFGEMSKWLFQYYGIPPSS